MMVVFDLLNTESFPHHLRDKNVFYQCKEFKTRIIALSPGQAIPECQMDSHVLFYVIKGSARIHVNGEESLLQENQVLITEPAVLSMETESGVKIMGIQIQVSA